MLFPPSNEPRKTRGQLHSKNTVTSRELIQRLIARQPAPRCGFWLGNPHPDTWPILHRYFGTTTEEELPIAILTVAAYLTAGWIGKSTAALAHWQSAPL